MPSYSSATIVGNLGKDPEQRGDMCKVSVAVTKKRKDKPETVTWWNLTEFSRTDELMMRLKKGECAMFIGEPELREYADKNGVVKQSLDLTVRELVFLGGRPSGGGNGGEQKQHDPAQGALGGGGDIDDIPFVRCE